MVIDKKTFCEYIEDTYLNNDESLIDVVLGACEKFNIEIEYVNEFLNRVIKEKLHEEFVQLKFIPQEEFKVIDE